MTPRFWHCRVESRIVLYGLRVSFLGGRLAGQSFSFTQLGEAGPFLCRFQKIPDRMAVSNSPCQEACYSS